MSSDLEFRSDPAGAAGEMELLPTAATGVERPLLSERFRRLLPRTLTARLVSGVVALVVLLVAAIGAATYLSLASFLGGRFDQQLDSAATQNVGFIENCVARGGLCTNYGAPSTEREWIAILRSNGTTAATIGPGGNLRNLSLSPSLRRELANGSVDSVAVHQSGTDLRVTARSTSEGIVVVTGLSTIDVDKTLGRLIALEIIIGAVAIAVSLLATTAGVRFGLRRLRRVTTTAQDVAAELSPEGAGLDRRVPDDEPETEVGQLATSFNTMLSAVETQFGARVESERRMRQFLADASHELRTPLTSIRGYAELARMQRAAGDTSADTYGDNLDRIEFEGTRMSRLVEDLLVLARGDAEDGTRMNHELIDLPSLVDDAVSGSRAAFPDRPIDFAVDGEPHIIGDRDQLLRVVRNLVNNAAVHTAPGRPISVRGLRYGDDVVVQVIDGGPGLPADDAAHVFERFWRADKARTRARGGSGLGLSIVAAIVRAHGGTVRFDSAVETGSTVKVTLPATTPGVE